MRFLVLFFILLINGGSFAQVVLLAQTSHHLICIIFYRSFLMSLYKITQAGMLKQKKINNTIKI
jgi:hypothetical protein